MKNRAKTAETPKIAGVIWPEVMVDVHALKPFEKNPRTISAERYHDLVESLARMGLHDRIRATSDFRVIGGHQRIKALKELGYRRIPVLMPPEGMVLSDEQFIEEVIRGNTHAGTFDSILALELAPKESLIAWGMPAASLEMPASALAGEDDQGKLDEVSFFAGKRAPVKCPKCNHEFNPKKDK